MDTITASELQRNFGKYQALAQRKPVKVTSHGRDSVVLISAEDYERYVALDSRVAMSVAELQDDLVEEMERSLEKLDSIEAAEMKKHGPW